MRSSVVQQSNALSGKWRLWFDKATPKGLSETAYMSGLEYKGTAHSLDSVCEMWNQYSENNTRYPEGQNFRVFRDGVMPTWEDPQNKNGGKFATSFVGDQEVKSGVNFFLQLLSLVTTDSVPFGSLISGVVFCKREWGVCVSLWLTKVSPLRRGVYKDADFEALATFYKDLAAKARSKICKFTAHSRKQAAQVARVTEQNKENASDKASNRTSNLTVKSAVKPRVSPRSWAAVVAEKPLDAGALPVETEEEKVVQQDSYSQATEKSVVELSLKDVSGDMAKTEIIEVINLSTDDVSSYDNEKPTNEGNVSGEVEPVAEEPVTVKDVLEEDSTASTPRENEAPSFESQEIKIETARRKRRRKSAKKTEKVENAEQRKPAKVEKKAKNSETSPLKSYSSTYLYAGAAAVIGCLAVTSLVALS